MKNTTYKPVKFSISFKDLMSPTHIHSETLMSPTYAPAPESPSTATPTSNSLALTLSG